MSKLTDLTPRLDPEFAAIFGALPKPAGPANVATSRAMLRQMVGMLLQQLPAGEPVPHEDREIPGAPGAPAVPVRIFRPAQGTSDSVFVWIHGGGFVAGHHEDDALVAIPWVRATGCTVVSVGYRLAPEAKAPGPTEDCYAALCWAADKAAHLGFVPRKLAIGGMSAGGCLAAATVLMARDRGGPQACLQMLLIPVIDNRHQTPSMHEIADPRTWNQTSSRAAWEMYAGPEYLGELSPYIAPARAKNLAGLPPCYMEVAEIDPLRDEAIEYATRLMQAGVHTELHVYPGACHASTLMFPNAAVSRRAFADCTAALKAALA